MLSKRARLAAGCPGGGEPARRQRLPHGFNVITYSAVAAAFTVAMMMQMSVEKGDVITYNAVAVVLTPKVFQPDSVMKLGINLQKDMLGQPAIMEALRAWTVLKSSLYRNKSGSG